MSRLTRINLDGNLQTCTEVEFERSPLWTDLLGPIPSPLQGGQDEQEREPESEDILQRLIEFYPGVLPWHEFSRSPDENEVRVCVVAKEVSAAETDVLLVERTPTGSGRFVIVETKLIKNAESHREVLGQILAYAARLTSSQTSKDLEESAINYWMSRGHRFKGNFNDEMKKAFGEDWREGVWKSAFDNLRRGDVRLLIVSDHLYEELRLAVTFLPSNVLLSAIEVQPHQGTTEGEKLLTVGASSASAIGAEKLQAAKEEYFSRILLSYAQVQMLVGGCIRAEPVGRNGSTVHPPIRSYEDHMEKLGGDQTMPGRALALLERKALATNGHIHEGQKSLTIRFWNLNGLYAHEKDRQLNLDFWAGSWGKDRKDEVRSLFLKQFPKPEKLILRHTGAQFYFRFCARIW